MKFIYLLIAVELTIAACSSVQAPASSKPSTFFDNPVCQPPCWENVTPGVTTTDVAMTVFAKLADRTGISDLPSPYKAYVSEITFSPSPGDYAVFAETLDGKIMTMEFLQEQAYGVNLKHAIELFGEPQNVIVSLGTESVYDDADFYNPTHGVALSADYIPRAASGLVAIGPNTWLYAIEFFDPNHYDSYLDARYNGFADKEKELMQPWRGYGSYQEYYSPPTLQSP